MSTAAHKKLVLDVLAARLRPAAFTRKGALFTRELPEVLQFVGVQSSSSSTAEVARVTVNLSVSVRTLLDGPRRAGIWDSHWRRRIGELMTDPSDRWWELDSDAAAHSAANEVAGLLDSVGIAALDALRTAHDLITLWEAGQSPGLTDVQRQRYLAVLKRLH